MKIISFIRIVITAIFTMNETLGSLVEKDLYLYFCTTSQKTYVNSTETILDDCWSLSMYMKITFI